MQGVGCRDDNLRDGGHLEVIFVELLVRQVLVEQRQNLRPRLRCRVQDLQGYLAQKKDPPRKTLQ